MYFVYVLENPEGKFYIGSTSDIEKRLQQHNSVEKDGTKFTHKNGPWCLIWSEQHSTRASAMRRERQIKQMKSARWIREKLLQKSYDCSR
jgi:putative endonuclease